jgi:hypothetical protein
LKKHRNLVHGPVHADWLDQMEIYFSIIQGKVGAHIRRLRFADRLVSTPGGIRTSLPENRVNLSSGDQSVALLPIPSHLEAMLREYLKHHRKGESKSASLSGTAQRRIR